MKKLLKKIQDFFSPKVVIIKKTRLGLVLNGKNQELNLSDEEEKEINEKIDKAMAEMSKVMEEIQAIGRRME